MIIGLCNISGGSQSSILQAFMHVSNALEDGPLYVRMFKTGLLAIQQSFVKADSYLKFFLL